MMIGKRDACGEPNAGRFEALKELGWLCNTAECHHRAVHRRHVHAPLQPPNEFLPAPRLGPFLNLGFVFWNRKNVRPFRCMQASRRLPAGKQMIGSNSAAQEQNVHIAMKLAMLKPVVENVSFGSAAFPGILRRASASSPAWYRSAAT